METQNTAFPGPSVRFTNRGGCADFFGVTPATVDGWIRKGMPVVQAGSHGVSFVIDLLEVARWRFAPPVAATTDPDSMEPMQRRAWYEGEVKKREIQIKDRELIPAAEVETVVATAFAALASDIRAIPDNLERRHGVRGDVAEQVEDALNEAMDALADRLSRMAPVTEEAAA